MSEKPVPVPQWMNVAVQAMLPTLSIVSVLGLVSGLALIIAAPFLRSWIAVASGGVLLTFGGFAVREFMASSRLSAAGSSMERLAMLAQGLANRHGADA